MAAVRAGCPDSDCPGSANTAVIEIPEIAPGILDVPELHCGVCGYQCRTEPVEGGDVDP